MINRWGMLWQTDKRGVLGTGPTGKKGFLGAGPTGKKGFLGAGPTGKKGVLGAGQVKNGVFTAALTHAGHTSNM